MNIPSFLAGIAIGLIIGIGVAIALVALAIMWVKAKK